MIRVLEHDVNSAKLSSLITLNENKKKLCTWSKGWKWVVDPKSNLLFNKCVKLVSNSMYFLNKFFKMHNFKVSCFRPNWEYDCNGMWYNFTYVLWALLRVLKFYIWYETSPACVVKLWQCFWIHHGLWYGVIHKTYISKIILY